MLYATCLHISCRFLKIITLTSFLLAIHPAITQNLSPEPPQKPDSTRVLYFNNHIDLLGKKSMKTIDTAITHVQRYNRIRQFGDFYATLGNIGKAHKSLLFCPLDKSGFDLGLHGLDHYRFHNDSVRYFLVNKPYTHVFYVMGSKKEQNLDLTHAQNLTGWLNFGLDFNYINSPGYYRRQLADDKNFSVNFRITPRNSRYRLLAHYLHNKVRMEENGGIRYDSVFKENVITSRESIIVNLNTAENRWKENNYYVKQIFRIGNDRLFEQQDSLPKEKKIRLLPEYISHSFLLSKSERIYSHNVDDHSFYRMVFDSASPTYDSTFVYKIENIIAFSNPFSPGKSISYSLEIKHQYIEISGYTDKRYLNLIVPAFRFSILPLEPIRLSARGDYVFGDFYGDDYHIAADVEYTIGQFLLDYRVNFSKQRESWFLNNYTSNHFRWDNSFPKHEILTNEIRLGYKRLTISLTDHTINRPVYLDSLAMAVRHPGQARITGVRLEGRFGLGHFNLDVAGVYQYSSKTDIYPLPDFMGDFSFYYTRNLFKKAAILQTGFDGMIHSRFQSYGYMPALMSYFPQKGGKTGNYLFTDFFLNLQIKKARLFLKYHNLGYLAQQFDYYMVPSYPMQDGGFRFGISWMFYD